ncbi:MAG: DUF1289 domain-containing protein [Alphaproteobacteria bacterium]|nr:DUF1289 domain-containing protein [Alphaproteobacteria bacterium]
MSEPTASPCVRLCVIDPHIGLCRGCWRTLAEIAAWPNLDDPARRRVLEAAAARRGG